jgi:hypothetical protein
MTTQYVTGTTSGTTPADTIRTALATPMANAGWTFIETATPGGTAAYDVYKSPGGSNAIGADWFLAIGRVDSTAANLQVRLFEQWDGTNKKAIKYAPSATSVPASDGSVNDATGLLLNSASLFQHSSGGGSTSVSSITYYFNITIDRVWFATSTPAVYHYGTYDRLLASTDDPMPLAMLRFTFDAGAAQTTFGAATRELKNVGAATYNFFVQTGYGTSMAIAWGPTAPYYNVFAPGGGESGADAIYFSGAYAVGRPMIHPSRGFQYTNRGVCKPGLYVASSSAGVAGDTATLTRADGTTQSCVWVNSYMYLATS